MDQINPYKLDTRLRVLATKIVLIQGLIPLLDDEISKNRLRSARQFYMILAKNRMIQIVRALHAWVNTKDLTATGVDLGPAGFEETDLSEVENETAMAHFVRWSDLNPLDSSAMSEENENRN